MLPPPLQTRHQASSTSRRPPPDALQEGAHGESSSTVGFRASMDSYALPAPDSQRDELIFHRNGSRPHLSPSQDTSDPSRSTTPPRSFQEDPGLPLTDFELEDRPVFQGDPALLDRFFGRRRGSGTHLSHSQGTITPASTSTRLHDTSSQPQRADIALREQHLGSQQDLSQGTLTPSSTLTLHRTRASSRRPRTPQPMHQANGHQDDHLPSLTWDLDLLNEVLSRPVARVLKSIPSGARREVVMCLSEIMQSILHHPHDVGAYVRLFLFPRAVLRQMPASELERMRRKRRRHAQKVFTLRCLAAWKEGGDVRDGLVRDVIAMVPYRRASGSESSNLKRCERIAREDGQFTKALKALGAHGLASFDSETTFDALRALHPAGPPVTLQPDCPEGIEVDSDMVRDLLQSFPKGTSSGRSGMAVVHLVECCSDQTGGRVFLDQLTALVNLFLSGKAHTDFASFMASANLVPLLKKDGRSIRPIAVGEVLRRLISKCCVKRFTSTCKLQVLIFNRFRSVLECATVPRRSCMLSIASFVIPLCVMRIQS